VVSWLGEAFRQLTVALEDLKKKEKI